MRRMQVLLMHVVMRDKVVAYEGRGWFTAQRPEVKARVRTMERALGTLRSLRVSTFDPSNPRYSRPLS